MNTVYASTFIKKFTNWNNWCLKSKKLVTCHQVSADEAIHASNTDNRKQTA